jgi:hypothetical protein
VNPEAREGVAELGVGAAVEPAAGDDVVARLAEGEDRLNLGGVAARCRQRADAPFQAGDALLQHIRGGVHDPGVDVAGFLQGKQRRGVRRIAELVAGRLVDRHRATTGGRIRLLAGVELAGVEAEGV